jgi:hypothetical protein
MTEGAIETIQIIEGSAILRPRTETTPWAFTKSGFFRDCSIA